ncbi:MAG: glycosyltransferase family 4 protein [Anaerolineae bacterium]
MPDARLKVCFASILFYPVYAGAAIRFVRYAPLLASKGIDLTAFAGTPEGELGLADASVSEQPGTFLPLVTVDGMAAQRVKLPLSGGFRRQMTYLKALIAYCRHPSTRPDVIQAISVTNWWLLRYFSFRRLGIPVVYAYTLLGEMSGNPLKRGLQHLYWPLRFNMMDCIVVSSQLVRQRLLEFNVKTRIEVIPNGVDPDRFRPVESPEKKRDLRGALGLDPNGEFILYVGALIKRKGIDRLLEAWKLIARERPSAYLLLVGPDERNVSGEQESANFSRYVEETIRASGAGDRVILTGEVSDVQVYFQVADVFVFPSRREGMGNVVLEAFSSGLASVLTPYTGLPEELGTAGEHYVLADPSPQALSVEISRLLDDPARRGELGRKSREWVEENLTIGRSIDQFAALYRDLARKRK